MGICGNGVDSDILIEAGVKDADLFIAVTDSVTICSSPTVISFSRVTILSV
ncbi:MAG: hypothetical protein J6D09_02795 [Clostridia bacterium]|nr:hypothetical protein [Clostridia bacterium]